MESPTIFKNTGLKLATSTKDDGHTSFSKISDEETENNINRYVDELGWGDKSRAFMRITYSEDGTYDVITVIDNKNKPPRKFAKKHAFDVDALVTSLPGVALLLPTADCYPVVLFDPKNEVLALCHIGWHSTAAHLLQKVIKLMEDKFGSKPADLLIHIGPGVPADYYVFEEPAQLNMPGWERYLKKQKGGWGIDLLGYNLAQLEAAGASPDNIEVGPRNTVEDDDLESNYVHNRKDLPVARRFLTAVMMS